VRFGEGCAHPGDGAGGGALPPRGGAARQTKTVVARWEEEEGSACLAGGGVLVIPASGILCTGKAVVDRHGVVRVVARFVLSFSVALASPNFWVGTLRSCALRYVPTLFSIASIVAAALRSQGDCRSCRSSSLVSRSTVRG